MRLAIIDSSRQLLARGSGMVRSRLGRLTEPAVWAAVRIPAPARLVVLSQSPVAMVIAAVLLLSAVLHLLFPTGILGLSLAILSWVGALGLGAMAIRSRLLQNQIDLLQQKLKTMERELMRLQNDAEESVVSKVRARGESSPAAEPAAVPLFLRTTPREAAR